MSLTPVQRQILDHLRSAYVGPEGGPQEEIVNGRPNLHYAVGMLNPPESSTASSSRDPGLADEHSLIDSDVVPGEIEDLGAGVPLAEDWQPSSVAVSFLTDGDTVLCNLSGGTYALLDRDGPPIWQRSPFSLQQLKLDAGQPPLEQTVGGIRIQIGSRWRPFQSASLVTVHVRVLTPATEEATLDAAHTLYQVLLEVMPESGGHILEYDTAGRLDQDQEAAELRFRFRDRKVYAVGHGMAADWDTDESGSCTRVFLDPVPSFVVPNVETIGFDAEHQAAKALRLDFLATIDSSPDLVVPALQDFVDAFNTWISDQQNRVAAFGPASPIAQAIIDRSVVASQRMESATQLLRQPQQEALRGAFGLAMAAMRLQMRRARFHEGLEDDAIDEPAWRPFQLGFILVALASTVDERHEHRELVDLIWFPTGGGKTEAYLGLTAIEMFHRRLAHGSAGGGTAVITRYTLRLLTAQQFQRASSLICAMELLRRPDKVADERATGMMPFTIGLWVGNEVTPGTRSEALDALERLHKAARPEEANLFQIQSCPWCGTNLTPSKQSVDLDAYGMKRVGRDVVMHCTNADCDFFDELPVVVVDEVLYENPPTFLLATVDKFARLQFKPQAGRLLGLSTPFRQPSVIIQDELHLLSGPLGTTVAVFDAVLQLLLKEAGPSPKIIASTATIRASEEQVRGLYGRNVRLYPPSGLDDDRNFFSRPVGSGRGRLYIGLMPQSLSQASAVIAAASPLLELPGILAKAGAQTRDAYWTTVMYHNSLRELGRTSTLVVDDVDARLEARAPRLGIPHRKIRADRVLELTSRRGPDELPNDLRELGVSIDQNSQAVDVVLSSNMLSVGIDVPRLALMLMVGQPKTTSEYIQATSRVGRGAVEGVVTTLFRSNRARDRSHFETFRAFHESLYRTVEPTSVTPWSLASRDRSLAGALVMLMRNSFRTLSPNSAAVLLDLSEERLDRSVTQRLEDLEKIVRAADMEESDETMGQFRALLRDWVRRAEHARSTRAEFVYERTRKAPEALLKRFGQPGEGWLVADSMRSVEPNVAIEVREPHGGE